jgi:tetratricopeptide (TPR) repeat protein
MKRILLTVVVFLGIYTMPSNAQYLFTMNNACNDKVKKGTQENAEGNHTAALATYQDISATCKSKDGKIAGAAGQARALNGLKRYDEALVKANDVLKVDKNNLYGYFERGSAYSHLGKSAEATADFEKVIQITEKNQDLNARAMNYAYLADLYRQDGNNAKSDSMINKAIELNPNNPNVYIQRGDMRYHEGNYTAAFADYDKAVALGKTDLEMYQIRATARINIAQKKYGTTNGNELKKKLTESEKNDLCTDLNKAISLGWKDPKMDYFSALVCK